MRETQEMWIECLGRSPGGVNGNPVQYSRQENSTDIAAWQATAHGVTKSQTILTMHTHSGVYPPVVISYIFLFFYYFCQFLKHFFILYYCSTLSFFSIFSLFTSDSDFTFQWLFHTYTLNFFKYICWFSKSILFLTLCYCSTSFYFLVLFFPLCHWSLVLPSSTCFI